MPVEFVKDPLFQKCYNWSLKYLEIRPRSCKEIHDYLKIKIEWGIKKGWLRLPEDRTAVEMIDEIISKLQKVNLVNDQEFAKMWVESRSKSRSTRILKGELFKKGIAREIIDQTIAEAVPNQTQLLSKVAALAAKKYQSLPTREAKQKLYSYLLRRGFEWEEVRRVVDETLK